MRVLGRADRVQAEPASNQVTYEDVFDDISIRFTCKNNRLKEAIVLSQLARDRLSNPKELGLNPRMTYLIFTSQFDLSPAQMRVKAKPRVGPRKDVKTGNVFNFEGKDRIEFSDGDSTFYAFFPEDFAVSVGDSAVTGKEPVLRRFYSERGKHFFAVGVPYSWIANAPAGDIVIDPTVATGATQDVWLETASNLNAHAAGLLVGKAGLGLTKRTLVQFDLSGVPANAQVVSARLKLKYYTSVSAGGSWVDRNIEAHQMLVTWDESQATKTKRTAADNWAATLGLAGTDYKSAAESTVLFTASTIAGSYQYWNLTWLTREWLDGTAANYGVMLIADNETVVGHDLRFHSIDSAPSLFDQPTLEVEWTLPQRTVYYLKDHPG